MPVRMTALSRPIDWHCTVGPLELAVKAESAAGSLNGQVSVEVERGRTKQAPDLAQVDALIRDAVGRGLAPHDLAAHVAAETGGRVTVTVTPYGQAPPAKLTVVAGPC